MESLDSLLHKPASELIGSPQDYHIGDLFNFQRWMCSNCSLIFDYQFDQELPGWPDFDPPLSMSYPWEDEHGNACYDEPDREELCPRCGIYFNEYPLTVVIVREVKKLSDFFQLGDSENLSLEFKEDFATDNIRKTIAAFATTKGGNIILGINNQGISIGYQGEVQLSTSEGKDKLLQRIRGLVSNIDPKVQYRTYIIEDDGKFYVVIVVPKGASPLYSINGKQYIRELDQSRPVTTSEILEITQKWHDRHKS